MARREVIWNDELEQGILGAAMVTKAGLRAAVLTLTESDFYRPAHADIFRVIAELNRKRKKPDLTTVVNALKERGELEQVGGVDYVVQVGELSCLGVDAQQYADAVKRDSHCRSVIEACTKAVKGLQGAEDLDGALDALRGAVKSRSRGGMVSAGDVDCTDNAKGCKSAFDLVNSKSDKAGWPRGQMCLIGAYPGGGKTTLMIQDMVSAVLAGERVVYATFGDLSAAEIMGKVMRQITGWTHPPVQAHLYDPDEWRKHLGDFKLVHDLTIYEAKRIPHGKRISTFADELRAHADKGPIDRVYADYAQTIRGDGQTESQYSERAHVSEELAALAEELNCPIIVGTQLSYSQSEGIQPKGARDFFEDCGVAVYLQWSDGHDAKSGERKWSWARPDDGEDLVLLRLAKNRFGYLGRREAFWSDQFTKFEERAI